MSEVKRAPAEFLRSLLESAQRKIANRAAWGIILFVVAAVLGGHFLLESVGVSRRARIASEIGSIARFIGKPEAPEDGSEVSFSRGVEVGGALFVYNLSTGQEKLLYQDSGNRRQVQYGWSPDGKMIAFMGLSSGQSALLIYNEETGQIETPLALYGTLNEFEWLSSSSFVIQKGGSTQLVSQKPNNGLMRVDRQANGIWSPPYYFAKESKAAHSGKTPPRQYTPVKGLMATSDNSVAWTTENAIWELKFRESEPELIWDGADTNKIVSCSYAPNRGAFLLRLRSPSGQYLAVYTPSLRKFSNLGDLANPNAVSVRWVNHEKGYAYLVNEADSHALFIKADCSDDRPIQRVQEDGVREFTAAGDGIYAYGCLDGQPEGVVEYNATSGSSRYAVPSVPLFRVVRNIIPSNGMLTNSAGETHAYRLWTPANFDSRKKYPAVLAQQRNVWNENAEAVANAGAFYISVDRPDFNHPQIQHWTEDVMAAYQLMSMNPNVDTNNLYLTGSSDETRFVCELLNQEPLLWKGAVLSSPTAFPDLSHARLAKLLIISGDSDEYNTLDKIKQFQKNAARAGIPVTLAVVPSGHIFVSTLSNNRSVDEFIRFVFE